MDHKVVLVNHGDQALAYMGKGNLTDCCICVFARGMEGNGRMIDLVVASGMPFVYVALPGVSRTAVSAAGAVHRLPSFIVGDRCICGPTMTELAAMLAGEAVGSLVPWR